MCWGGGVQGKQGCQASEATWQARSPYRRGRQAGKVARQARPVRPSCTGGGGVPGRQGRQAGKVARQVRPVRLSCACAGGQYTCQARPEGHHVLEGWCAYQARPVRPPCVGGVSGEAGRPSCA